MSNYPPHQPGYGPPPPPPALPPPSGSAPPRRSATRGNANGVIAAVVAGTVIVVGVVSTVLLVTGDGNTNPALAARQTNVPSGSHLPSGSHIPNGSPTVGVPDNRSSDVASGATTTGTQYFTDLDENLYSRSQSQWCTASSFPLTQTDVGAVASAYPLGPAGGGATAATMRGHIGLEDGRSGTITIYLSLRTDDTWCISSQSNLQ